MIGTGGIGAGMFFALRGNHTLGREESRLGRFLDRHDYCKLHIIAHYVQTLLGPQFTTIPLGKVGEDDIGRRLWAEMAEVGMDMRHVARVPDAQTMFAFCYAYPDGDGGNLTTDDSASVQVDPAYIRAAADEFARFAGCGVALAAPEVPMAARKALLELATAHRLLRVASFNSEEMPLALDEGYLALVDLLAINIDEASRVAGIALEGQPADAVARAAVERLRQIAPQMMVAITAGKQGSWGWDGETLTRVAPCTVVPVSAAGAGDAYLSGLIAGLVAGLPLADAQQLGGLVAGLSVTSPHTIDKTIQRETLRNFAQTAGAPLAATVRALLD